MYVISARNVNDAWAQAKIFLNANHRVRPSRVGEVWECPEPVTTHYWRPMERVLFDPLRNCNPTFHFMEGLWMLAGRNDVQWIFQFNKRMREYSDDGVTFSGAYGFRWRKWFDMEGGGEEDFTDQLGKIVRMLKKSPDERRAVLQMWDPVQDLERPDLKDLPCNLTIAWKIREGKLTMTVMCRSNDILFGCYGANAVHMSMLQEYMAARIGVPVGSYWQISDSFHAYTERWEQYGGNNVYAVPPDPYGGGTEYRGEKVVPYPMVADPETWDEELKDWMRATEPGPWYGKWEHSVFSNPFFPEVAYPLFDAWLAYKRKDYEEALESIKNCQASDWRLACQQWITRIMRNREK